MNRWTSLVILAAALLIAAVVLDTGRQEAVVRENETVVIPPTRTATLTRTPGWWAEVSTWTPSATDITTSQPAETQTAIPTPTPQLDIPPVRTVERPTHQPTPTTPTRRP